MFSLSPSARKESPNSVFYSVNTNSVNTNSVFLYSLGKPEGVTIWGKENHKQKPEKCTAINLET